MFISMYFFPLFRYDEIESKMAPFLKASGYNVKKGSLLTSWKFIISIFFKLRPYVFISFFPYEYALI